MGMRGRVRGEEKKKKHEKGQNESKEQGEKKGGKGKLE